MKKNVLITGASRGIGKSIYLLLKNNGFNCLVPTRNELDIGCYKSIEDYFENIDADIYALINCAGINILGSVDTIIDDDVNSMFNINLKAPLKIIQKVSRGMKKNYSGRIINISSIWGIRSKEYRTLYSATKFGLNGMTKALARELGEYNILINSIAPGYVNTEMTQKNVLQEEQKKIKENIPLKRFAEPEEIAKLVLFLISSDNTYITGETITIDGGFLA